MTRYIIARKSVFIETKVFEASSPEEAMRMAKDRSLRCLLSSLESWKVHSLEHGHEYQLVGEETLYASRDRLDDKS